MTYFLHTIMPPDPLFIKHREGFHKIDDDGMSRQYIYVFEDGKRIKVGRWRKISIKYRMGLGDQPWPSLEHLRQMLVESPDKFPPGVVYEEISKERFELEWKRAKYAW